jgi:hypothetical protein
LAQRVHVRAALPAIEQILDEIEHRLVVGVRARKAQRASTSLSHRAARQAVAARGEGAAAGDAAHRRPHRKRSDAFPNYIAAFQRAARVVFERCVGRHNRKWAAVFVRPNRFGLWPHSGASS